MKRCPTCDKEIKRSLIRHMESCYIISVRSDGQGYIARWIAQRFQLRRGHMVSVSFDHRREIVTLSRSGATGNRTINSVGNGGISIRLAGLNVPVGRKVKMVII